MYILQKKNNINDFLYIHIINQHNKGRAIGSENNVTDRKIKKTHKTNTKLVLKSQIAACIFYLLI